jgi:hypothetical protein
MSRNALLGRNCVGTAVYMLNAFGDMPMQRNYLSNGCFGLADLSTDISYVVLRRLFAAKSHLITATFVIPTT